MKDSGPNFWVFTLAMTVLTIVLWALTRGLIALGNFLR